MAFLYLPRTPLHHRLVWMMAASFGYAACYTIGYLAASLRRRPVLGILAATNIAVSLLVIGPQLLVVTATLPVNSVKELIGYAQARQIMTENRDLLETMATTLLEQEVLDGDNLKRFLEQVQGKRGVAALRSRGDEPTSEVPKPDLNKTLQKYSEIDNSILVRNKNSTLVRVAK